MKTNTMLGYKLFKENKDKDDFDIVRITRIYSPEKVRITHEDGTSEKVNIIDLKVREYTLLDPIGIISFSTIKVGDNDDVIITFTKHIDIKAGITVPCVICRQSVTDFFYTMLSTDEYNQQVGISVSDKTCPTNIEFGNLLACNDIIYTDMVNIYYDDTIDSVLECVKVLKFDDVLRKLYEMHIKAINKPALRFKNYHLGWCTNVKDLMVYNNFWIDVDQALMITDVDFEIENYIIEKKDEAGKEYQSFNADTIQFFCKTFELNIVDCIITEYGYDIDLSEYRNESYVLLRDSKEKVYLMVYLVEGVYLEQDIATIKEKEYLEGQYRLKIFDKYKK